MSVRGPPVCISSIAQQAKPNSKYHCDDVRPQFNNSSTLAVKAVSGSWFTNGMNLSLYIEGNADAGIVRAQFALISARYVRTGEGFRLGLAGISF
jgi:hypothetical protein